MKTDTRCFSFLPDAARAEAIDRAVRHCLIESVHVVLREMRRAGVACEGDFDAWSLRAAKPKRAPPLLWAYYHDLVQAVARADDGAISQAANELLAFEPIEQAPGNVITLSGPYLNEPDVRRYDNIIDDNPDTPRNLQAVAPAEVARIRHLLDAATDLISSACPALLAEIETLGHQIVLVSEGRGATEFGGAASIFLWGAVVLNPALIPDRIALVESLTHETAHALLFGSTLGENLTLNDPAERYASPLRPDLRPMEGIVHATFVLARMIHALDLLAQSDCLSRAERGLVHERRARHLGGYRAGLETVMAHARFAPEGDSIFSACAGAMAGRKTGARAYLKKALPRWLGGRRPSSRADAEAMPKVESSATNEV